MHADASAARRPVVSPVPEGVDRPLWSVMIPSFNSGARLARTLESVLAQDPGRDQMQIRVIDDASDRDDPEPLVRDLTGDRVSFWRQPRNVGAPTNFTTCVQQAVGRWVHILHSDDFVAPGFYDGYEQQITRLEPAMVVGRGYTVDDDEQIIALSPNVHTDRGLLLDAPRVIAQHHPFHFATVVVARTAYERLGGFDPGLVHANDWEMWSRVACHGPVAVVNEPLAMYRRHVDSDTNRLQRSTTYLRDVVEVIEILAERFDDPHDARSFRRDARRRWSELAREVAGQARRDGSTRNAMANAARSLMLDPRPASWMAVGRLLAGEA